jgi:prevent-host-death family protein
VSLKKVLKMNIQLSPHDTQLNELVERAERGETICLTRDGAPVARLVPIEPKATEKPRKLIDVDDLKAFTATLTPQTESAGDFMRRIRDEERY